MNEQKANALTNQSSLLNYIYQIFLELNYIFKPSWFSQKLKCKLSAIVEQ